MMKKIATDRAPAAIGPYSQGIIADDMLYASGQIALDPVSGNMVGTDITAQAKQVMENVGAILEEAGANYESVVKTTCYLADMADFNAFNEIYADYFTGRPARSCVAAASLPKGALCEVEVIAYLGD